MSTRQHTTRPLTGRPSWPITLLAGVEKSGKTYIAVEASGSDLIGEAFLVGLGEDDPDEYGAIPGCRVRMVEHDGTFRDLLDALTWAAEQPPGRGDGIARPNLLILDSGTRLWNLLSNQAQRTANERAARKAAKYGKNAPAEDVTIGMDLWNLAASRWALVMDVLRAHQGPSIVTARLDEVAVLDKAGTPVEGERRWKEQAHKSLPFDVGAIVHLRQPASPGRPAPAVLRGVRSLRVKPDEGSDEALFEGGLSMDTLWRGLGLADGPAGQRLHHPTRTVDDEPEEGEQPRAQREHQAPPAQPAQRAQQRPQEAPAASPAAHRAPAPAPRVQEAAQGPAPTPSSPPADGAVAGEQLLGVARRALDLADVAELARSYQEAGRRGALTTDVRAALDAEDRRLLEVPDGVAVPLGRLLQACGTYAQRHGCPVRWERLAEAQHRAEGEQRQDPPATTPASSASPAAASPSSAPADELPVEEPPAGFYEEQLGGAVEDLRGAARSESPTRAPVPA